MKFSIKKCIFFLDWNEGKSNFEIILCYGLNTYWDEARH